jgi:hypothetical protein
VGFGYRPHDRQPQARSARGAITRHVGPMEAVEDALTLIDGDARPIVFHEKAYASAGCPLDTHAHQP